MKRKHALSILAIFAIAGAAHAGPSSTTTVIDFENGPEGWTGSAPVPGGPGGVGTFIDPTNGVDGSAGFRTQFQDFGITFRNETNTDFIRDLSQFESVTFSVDVKVDGLTSLAGNDSIRPFGLQLRDFDAEVTEASSAGVFYPFSDNIRTDADGEFTTFSVTIDNTLSTEVPEGWTPFGNRDPDTFEPILPPDLTFTQLLAGVDAIEFTTLAPDLFFTMNNFDITLDNVSITTTVPTPGPAALLATGGLFALRRRR